MSQTVFYILLLFLHLVVACSHQELGVEILEDFSITEIAQSIVDAQDVIPYGYKFSELDVLDLNSLKIIITKAMHEDKFISSNINPTNLVFALYKTYISPQSDSKPKIIKAYTDAIEKSYHIGYFRIDISNFKTLTEKEKKEKKEEEEKSL